MEHLRFSGTRKDKANKLRVNNDIEQKALYESKIESIEAKKEKKMLYIGAGVVGVLGAIIIIIKTRKK